MRYKSSEIEKIHKEIFTDSIEHKYYTLGVAQGISFAYRLIDTYKDKGFTPKQLAEIIKNSVTQEDKVSEYFNRLIYEYENESSI